MDPTDLWRQWYETSTKLWSDAARGAQGGNANPADFYRRWFEGARGMQERMIGAAPGAIEGTPGGMQDMWQRWSEASTATLQKGAELGQSAVDLLPRWTQMLEEAGQPMPAETAAAPSSRDQWYTARAPLLQFVGKASSARSSWSLEPVPSEYEGFYKVFKQTPRRRYKPAVPSVGHHAGSPGRHNLEIGRPDQEVLEDLGDARPRPRPSSPRTTKTIIKP